jgi:hypothetical protein
MANVESLKPEDCVNETCPWSGRPVQADSLAVYRGHVVGFCNTGCRDKFDVAVALFDSKIDSTKNNRSNRRI